MRILIAAGATDPAGSMIMHALSETLETRSGPVMIGSHEVSLLLTEQQIIRWTPPSGYDLIIFLSKHAARSGNDAMCVHAIGNFSEATLGGRDHALVETDPAMLTSLYRSLKAAEPVTSIGRYEVSLEAVHHGPYTRTPSIFYELGASEENWTDAAAARIMIGVLIDVLGSTVARRTSVFGLGSNHYCAAFDELVDRFDFAGSCPKHSLSDLTAEHLRWIDERYDRLVLDWASMGPEKRRVVRLLDELGIGYERRKRMRET